jgi:hypothetical protein
MRPDVDGLRRVHIALRLAAPANAALVRNRRRLLDLRFVLFEPGHPQFFDGIPYRRFISRLGVCGSNQDRRASAIAPAAAR